MLNNAANAQYLRDALWTIGGIIVTAAVVIGTGGTAAIGLAVVLAGGDVALQATFDIVQRTEETKPYRTVKAFLDKVKECQIDSRNLPQVCTSVQRQCAYNTVQDFYATLMQFQEDLPDTTISQMTDAYRTVEHCTTDEDLEFAYNAAVKDVDKASFSVGGLVMMGSFLLSFRNPERTISQLAKTTKLLKRINVKPVERVSSTLGGRKYYRIYINGSGGTLSINEIDNIISELKSKGLYVSSGTETGTGKKFLAFSNKNVFKPWEDNVGNWRFAVQHEGIEIVSASREQFVERLKRYTGYDFEYRTVADDEFARMYGNYYRLKIDNLGYDEVNNIRSKLGETGVKSANIQNNLFLVIYENNMDVFRPNLKAIASERFDQYLAAALAPEPKFYMLPKSRLNDQEWDQLNVMIRKQGVGFVETSQNGTAYMIFRRVTPDADDSWIFSNIYNGMPEEILNQKLSYVVRVAQVSGDDPEAIVDALRYIKAFDEQKASVFIQDLANDIVRRINNMDSNIVERMRNWQKLNKTEREDLVLELHEIVTTERRDRVGNTIIEFDTGSQGVNGAHRVPYGDDPRLFKYRVMRDNFGDVLNTIIHENVHAFQSVGTSTINEYFVNWAKRVYSNDANSRLYWESILEKESSYIGQQTSYSILRQLGLL